MTDKYKEIFGARCCSRCDYFECPKQHRCEPPLVEDGLCRRHAPMVSEGNVGWPRVTGRCWCGEFKVADRFVVPYCRQTLLDEPK
jgi:hypothetical protein